MFTASAGHIAGFTGGSGVRGNGYARMPSTAGRVSFTGMQRNDDTAAHYREVTDEHHPAAHDGFEPSMRNDSSQTRLSMFLMSSVPCSSIIRRKRDMFFALILLTRI